MESLLFKIIDNQYEVELLPDISSFKLWINFWSANLLVKSSNQNRANFINSDNSVRNLSCDSNHVSSHICKTLIVLIDSSEFGKLVDNKWTFMLLRHRLCLIIRRWFIFDFCVKLPYRNPDQDSSSKSIWSRVVNHQH